MPRNPAKLLRKKLAALRLLETSFPRVAMDGTVVGRATHYVFTYTPQNLPFPDEKYQLTIPQIQELIGLAYEVIGIAEKGVAK